MADDEKADEVDEATTADGEASKPTSASRVKPMYCKVCTLPIEYCEFQPSFERCREWLVKDWPTLFPDASSEEEMVAMLTKLGLEGEPDAAAKKAREAKKPPADAGDGGGDDGGAGGGKGAKKGKAPPQVVITINQRNKRKFITQVAGLEHHGVKLSDAAKAFGKKLSSGSSVTKGKGGQGDVIDIQGDFRETIADIIAEQFGVPPEAIKVKDS